jgi:hypothetical protein
MGIPREGGETGIRECLPMGGGGGATFHKMQIPEEEANDICRPYIYLGDPLLVHRILGDDLAAVQRAHVEGSAGYPPRGGEEEERGALGGSPGGARAAHIAIRVWAG